VKESVGEADAERMRGVEAGVRWPGGGGAVGGDPVEREPAEGGFSGFFGDGDHLG
jgi:hypothetical protein